MRERSWPTKRACSSRQMTSLTSAALDHNIEMGLLVRNRPLVLCVVTHLLGPDRPWDVELKVLLPGSAQESE